MKDKRYTVTVQMYVWAANDKEAIQEAKSIVEDEIRENDNNCRLISVTENEFGSMPEREVKL